MKRVKLELIQSKNDASLKDLFTLAAVLIGAGIIVGLIISALI